MVLAMLPSGDAYARNSRGLHGFAISWSLAKLCSYAKLYA